MTNREEYTVLLGQVIKSPSKLHLLQQMDKLCITKFFKCEKCSRSFLKRVFKDEEKPIGNMLCAFCNLTK